MDNITNSEPDSERIFGAVYNDIKKFQKEDKIIKMFSGENSPRVMNIPDLCSQHIDGLLYDLNLEQAYLATIHKNDPLEFANQMAVANVIRFLHKFYKDYKDMILTDK